MPKDAKPRLAILGAGPIGLEAALYAQTLELPYTVYERGRVGEHLRRWGHVRLFTPWGTNVTPLGRQKLLGARPQQTLPADDAILTGREHVEQYLTPLAGLLGARVRTETHVVQVGKRGLLKHDSPGAAARGQAPFVLLVREKNQERLEEADVVLDCTGTYGQHRWLGAGGIPAAGELALEPHIVYGLEDVLGEKQKDYANKAVLIIGGGYSAATTACNLATLAEGHNTTWITWLARGPQSQPLRRLANDPWRERDRLAARANTLATRSDANVSYHAGSEVEALLPLGQGAGFRVVGRCAGKPRTWEAERLIANVGYTPDVQLYRELQVRECPATLAPKGSEGGRAGSPESLRQAEPNLYVLGAKSQGRGAQFFLRQGFEQVRDVFRLVTGDGRLDLHKSKG